MSLHRGSAWFRTSMCVTFIYVFFLEFMTVVEPWVIRTSLHSPSLWVIHNGASSRRVLKIFSQTDDNRNDLLEKARQLRVEAQELEENLINDPRKITQQSNKSSLPSSSTVVLPPSELEDSVWTISYRFSAQPISDGEEDEDKNRQNGAATTSTMYQQQQQQRFYSGKVTLKFKRDGYTELLDQANSRSVSSPLHIAKVWGWDKETSNEDDKDYILFSMDVVIPETDPDSPGQKERFYFQARVNDDSSSSSSPSRRLSLKDGTVTVKKDVSEKTSGWWGLFRVGGILTQFRYVGDFVAKPSSPKRSTQD